MSTNPHEEKAKTTAKAPRLRVLKQLLENFSMLDLDDQSLKESPITESLKLLHRAFMESPWPGILHASERAILNDHFWKIYETASFIERLPNAAEERNRLLEILERQIQASPKTGEEGLLEDSTGDKGSGSPPEPENPD
jgi:hypothetical protein